MITKRQLLAAIREDPVIAHEASPSWYTIAKRLRGVDDEADVSDFIAGCIASEREQAEDCRLEAADHDEMAVRLAAAVGRVAARAAES